MFLPESLGTSFLAGFWLDAAEKIGTVQVMQDKDKLQEIKKQNELAAKIAVLTTPTILDLYRRPRRGNGTQ